MKLVEETIEATLDLNGHLQLSHPPQVQPGPVRVTIRVGGSSGPKRSLADVVREIAATQRARGFLGRSSEELRAEELASFEEDAEWEKESNAARNGHSPGDV